MFENGGQLALMLMKFKFKIEEKPFNEVTENMLMKF